MRMRLVRLVLALTIGCLITPALTAPAEASAYQIDDEVPPGNPVVGSDAPGDQPAGGTNYLLLAAIAAGLILLGALLVKLESWERDRIGQDLG